MITLEEFDLSEQGKPYIQVHGLQFGTDRTSITTVTSHLDLVPGQSNIGLNAWKKLLQKLQIENNLKQVLN